MINIKTLRNILLPLLTIAIFVSGTINIVEARIGAKSLELCNKLSKGGNTSAHYQCRDRYGSDFTSPPSGGNSSSGEGGGPAGNGAAGTFTGLSDQGCGRYTSGGFLWKPISESNGNLVVLIPSAYTGATKRDTNRITTEGGRVIEPGHAKPYTGDNGEREHYSFDDPGPSYGKNIYFAIDLASGGTARWRIENDFSFNGGRGCEGTYKPTEMVIEEALERNSEIIDRQMEKLNTVIQNVTSDSSDTDPAEDEIVLLQQLQDQIPMEYTYIDGVYELKGYLVLPNCYSHDIDFGGSGSNRTIDITVEREPSADCTNRLDTIIFEESIRYSRAIDLKAYINDIEVDLALYDLTRAVLSSSSDNEDYDSDYNDPNVLQYYEYNNNRNDDDDDDEDDEDRNNNSSDSEDADLATVIRILVALGIIPAEKANQALALVGASSQSTSSNTNSNVTPSNNYSNSSGYSRDLKLGSTGADVKRLQQHLNNLGYTITNSGAGSPGNETTYFGPATQAALVKFQQIKQISPATGYFGAKTRALIN